MVRGGPKNLKKRIYYHEGVVEGSKDVGNSEDELTLTSLGTESEVDDLLFLFDLLLGSLIR